MSNKLVMLSLAASLIGCSHRRAKFEIPPPRIATEEEANSREQFSLKGMVIRKGKAYSEYLGSFQSYKLTDGTHDYWIWMDEGHDDFFKVGQRIDLDLTLRHPGKHLDEFYKSGKRLCPIPAVVSGYCTGDEAGR